MEKQKKYPEGHFMGIGIAIGIAIFSGVGIAISNATDNPGLIGLGPALGVAIGVAIGSAMEEKAKKEGKIRPLTKQEKARQRKIGFIGLAIAAIALILVILTIVFLN
jgi:hypothetical protein